MLACHRGGEEETVLCIQGAMDAEAFDGRGAGALCASAVLILGSLSPTLRACAWAAMSYARGSLAGCCARIAGTTLARARGM